MGQAVYQVGQAVYQVGQADYQVGQADLAKQQEARKQLQVGVQAREQADSKPASKPACSAQSRRQSDEQAGNKAHAQVILWACASIRSLSSCTSPSVGCLSGAAGKCHRLSRKESMIVAAGKKLSTKKGLCWAHTYTRKIKQNSTNFWTPKHMCHSWWKLVIPLNHASHMVPKLSCNHILGHKTDRCSLRRQQYWP